MTTNLFPVDEPVTPAAKKLADGFLAEGQVAFYETLEKVYDTVERFWYRNRDADGNGLLEGSEPTGIEILQAMGTHARGAMALASFRAESLVKAQQTLQIPGLIDMVKLSGPYAVTFNDDGSFLAAVLK